VSDVDAVDRDGAAGALNDSEERKSQRGFAGAGSTNDPDLLRGSHRKGHTYKTFQLLFTSEM
jgi:hypothetical protein